MNESLKTPNSSYNSCSSSYIDHRDELYKKPNRTNVILLALQLALQVTNFTVVMPTSLSYVENLGGSKEFAGFMIGICAIVSGLFAIPYTKFMLKFGIKIGLQVSTALQLLMLLMYSFGYVSGSPWMLAASRFIGGLGAQGVFPLYISKTVGLMVRTKYFLLISNMVSLGYGLGPLIGAALYDISPSAKESSIFNFYSSPTFIMAFLNLSLLIVSQIYFQEPTDADFLDPIDAVVTRSRMDTLRSMMTFEIFTMALASLYFIFIPIIISSWELSSFNRLIVSWQFSVTTSCLIVAAILLMIVPLSYLINIFIAKNNVSDRNIVLIFLSIATLFSFVYLDFYRAEPEINNNEIILWTICSYIFLLTIQIARGAVNSVITKVTPKEIKVDYMTILGGVTYQLSRGIGAFCADAFDWNEFGENYSFPSPNDEIGLFLIGLTLTLTITTAIIHKGLVKHADAN